MSKAINDVCSECDQIASEIEPHGIFVCQSCGKQWQKITKENISFTTVVMPESESERESIPDDLKEQVAKEMASKLDELVYQIWTGK